MREAIENLLPIERNLFFALNGSDSIFLDNVFWTITGKIIWTPILLLLIVIFFYKTPIKIALLTIVALALVVTLCDQVSSSFFKEFYQRLRPTHHPDFKNFVDTVNGYRSKGYGFISGHATNSFGIAVFLSLIFKNRWKTIPVITWALLNSYSRVYLGVHFISDILAGMIVGSLIAILSYYLYNISKRYIISRDDKINNDFTYSLKSGKIIGVSFISYLLFIIIFSPVLATLHH